MAIPYRLRWEKNRTRGVELIAPFELPRVKCHTCGKTWGDPMIYYPTFKFSFLNEEEFNFERVVSLDEFDELRERFFACAGRRFNLVPGATIGNQGLRVLSRQLDDFIWGAITVPQISKRACELLEKEGISLLTADCKTTLRGRDIGTHRVLQVEPTELLTCQNVAELDLLHCSLCGLYMARPKLPTMKPWRLGEPEPEHFKIRKDRWPPGEHLVMCRETLRILASPEFMQAVRKHRLTGLQFLPCGEYV